MLSSRKSNFIIGLLYQWKKHFPTLMVGLLVLIITVTLIGGKAIFGVSGKSNNSNKGIISENRSLSTVDNNTEEATNKTGSATIKDGVQYITSSMTSGSYDSITVQQGIPVKWTLNVPKQALNDCNSFIVIPQYNIKLKLKA